MVAELERLAAEAADLRAPFPWFGGKRRVASWVWDALGDVQNYVEPFAGSLAVLLARPHDLTTIRHSETVNDADRYLANFWRAIQTDPEAVAFYADWPVNEADLFARHLWLVNVGREILRLGLESDPEWFDARVAGWWVWGQCAWIGSGWCSGKGPWTYETLTGKLPHLGDAGRGVNRKLPHLGNAGRGVNRKLPHLGNAGCGVHTARGDHLTDYFAGLAERLRNVRVCCGDWARVVTKGALTHGRTVGVFLDPPYLGRVRTKDLYAEEDHDVADEVRAWAIANGENPRLRIVLAGYEDEHAELMPDSWRKISYRASKAYGSARGGGVNDANRRKERLWLSPHCLEAEDGR